MRRLRLLVLLATALLVSSAAAAGDFDWMRDFNVRVQADPGSFRVAMTTRFQIGGAQVTAVLGRVASPADAYMVFRLGEISRLPPERVLAEYKRSAGKGWGVVAKNLGIKPGSAAFHTLKQGHDLDKAGNGKAIGKGNGKGKGKRK
jgi:hypothetical protein